MTKQINTSEQQRQAIQQTNKFDNSYARAQYKRNIDQLRKRQMDKLFSRKERLIDLYKNEEHELMKEFEEMKKQEKLEEFERQADMIKQFKQESQEIHDNTVKRSEQMRVNSSNQVIKEKMSLETAKTANQNKFSKAQIEHLKAEEESREKRQQDMQLLQNQEKENYQVFEKELKVKEVNEDYKKALVNQMMENQRIKEFNKEKEKRQYDELTQLEINQIDLEKKLEREKRNVTRNFLTRTIEENKIKIAEKKEQIKDAKLQEQKRMKELEAEIEEEKRQKKLIEIENKKKTQETMAKQLAAQQKAKEDEQELDKLAQKAQDIRNQEQDQKDLRNVQIRSQFKKDMLLHNQEKINEKQFHRNLEEKLVKDEKKDVTVKVNNWALEDNNLILEEKHTRNKTKKELREMMQVQEREIEAQKKNNLKLEKKLLEDSNKFDTFVTDIVAMKRQFLDKLREQRPF